LWSRILPYVLMIILLAAHFSRGGNDILAGVALLIPILFFVKQKAVILFLELIAYFSAGVWLFSAYQYIQIRSAAGDDWFRLLIIMGAVALYSAWTGFFLRSEKIRTVYRKSE